MQSDIGRLSFCPTIFAHLGEDVINQIFDARSGTGQHLKPKPKIGFIKKNPSTPDRVRTCDLSFRKIIFQVLKKLKNITFPAFSIVPKCNQCRKME
jgi:hypothetical protein